MRNLLLLLVATLLIAVAACKKSDSTPTGDGGNFQFSSLVAKDTVLAVNGITTITASATGDGLTYKWTASYGTFVGSGSSVQWTVCHADKFKITCVVKDNSNHSDTKDVYIRTKD
jgi:hypothetical protein